MLCGFSRKERGKRRDSWKTTKVQVRKVATWSDKRHGSLSSLEFGM